MLKKAVLGFTVLWFLALILIATTQTEMAQAFYFLYTFVAGIAAYLIGGALLLGARLWGEPVAKRRLAYGAGAILVAAPVVAGIWYAFTH